MRRSGPGGVPIKSSNVHTSQVVCPTSISFSSDFMKGLLIICSLDVFHIESTVIFSHLSTSSNSFVGSFQIVSKFFSPQMHMNFHLVEVTRVSSPSSSLHHLWWTSVWSSDRAFHVCWMWPRSCTGRSASDVKWFSLILRT